MNDFSPNFQQTMWWMSNASPNFSNHVLSDELYKREENTEHMFEKPLTPSDVGKLNRLVIPKQNAEKYFPLSRMESAEKGVLLTFEDEHGKLWRFRYSYWNSSQSYVLTKGWSRFVKEKQLDAGDVVSFERGRPDGQQLYIRWRRRVSPPVQDSRLQAASSSLCSTSSPWNSRVYYSAHPYPSHPLLYQPDCVHAVGLISRVGNDSVQPVVEKKVASKKQVRLFGVNLDCQLDEPESPGPDVSSQGQARFFYAQGGGLNPSIQQNFNFSREYHYPEGNE